MKKLIFIIFWLVYVIRIFLSKTSFWYDLGQIVGFTVFLIIIYFLIKKLRFRSIRRFFRRIRPLG